MQIVDNLDSNLGTQGFLNMSFLHMRSWLTWLTGGHPEAVWKKAKKPLYLTLTQGS